MKILLVDDHADTLLLTAKFIQMAGYEVDTAGDLKSAFKLCSQTEYALLVVDIGLPDGSGLELIKEHPRKSIVLSGYAMPSEVKRGQQCGAMAYLVKPVDIDVLLRHVHRAMGKVAPADGAPGLNNSTGSMLASKIELPTPSDS